MPNIHHHYDQLSYNERAFVDEVFEFACREAKNRKLPLNGTVEYAVDALAKALLYSAQAEELGRRKVAGAKL